MSNIIAIVGRPNVGKSTLFNRLIGTRKAIVNEESGVTRDRNYGKSSWNGKEFSVIDTGGYVCNSDDIFEEEINKQVMLAMDEADVIIFLVDAEMGITDLDQNFAQLLRNIDKPVYLVANKVDNSERLYEAQEFYRLGVKSDLFCISSMTGSGTGDLLDEVVKHFKEDTIEDTDHLPRITIVGRPNVGKSSTINALIGKERNIVTDIAAEHQGGLGTASSSNIGNKYAMFEAIHGTAPYLMSHGRGEYADPSSLIRAAGMMLAHIGYADKKVLLEKALDVCTTEKKVVLTTFTEDASAKEYTDYIIETIEKLK